VLIQAGKVSALSELPWVAIELTSDSRTDETVLHLVRWSVKHLEGHGKAFQLLYPVESRGFHAPIMLSPYLWMRTAKPEYLNRIISIQGVQGMVSDASGAPVLVEPGFVAALIEKARESSDAWSAGIVAGSSVRILLGAGRMLCGVVEHIVKDVAEVRIALRSRAVRMSVPVRALQNLGNKPCDYFEKGNDG